YVIFRWDTCSSNHMNIDDKYRIYSYRMNRISKYRVYERLAEKHSEQVSVMVGQADRVLQKMQDTRVDHFFNKKFDADRRQLLHFLLVHGDIFFELVRDPSGRIVTYQTLPANTMYRLQTISGEVIGFQQSDNGPNYLAALYQEGKDDQD